MSKNDLTAYHELLGDIKVRVRQAQIKAALSVNATMILLYWDIGRMIAGRQAQQGWGAKVIPRLAIDLKNELPEEKGFSPANLKRMVRLWSEYPELSEMGARAVRQFPPLSDSSVVKAESRQISAPTVRQIGSHMAPPAEVALILGLSWSHNIVLMQKLTDMPTRLWYARQTAEQGWSRDRLTAEIKSEAHRRLQTGVCWQDEFLLFCRGYSTATRNRRTDDWPDPVPD